MIGPKRRGKFEIYGDILAAVEEETARWGIAQPTRIQQKVNMPYDRFRDDLARLEKQGFVALNEDSNAQVSVKLTSMGGEFLEHYRNVKRFMETYGL